MAAEKINNAYDDDFNNCEYRLQQPAPNTFYYDTTV